MTSPVYVRNLRALKRKLELTDRQIATGLVISLRTCMRIFEGRPVSAKLARKISQNAKRKSWDKHVALERPTYSLRLSLDPRTVRYAQADLVPRKTLVSAEALQQAIDGRFFTAAFARKLKRFFRQIPLSSNEYAFTTAANFSGKHVDEWRAEVTSMDEGDELSDLTIVLRERFRSWMELPEKPIHNVMDKSDKIGAAKVIRLDLPKSAIQTLSNLEQNLLIAFGAAANELAFLTRLVTVSAHQKYKGRMYEAYALSQHLMSLKLFAGKIHECWRLVRLRFFDSKLSQVYFPLLPQRAVDAMRGVKKYFAKSNNIISLIRNEAAFHYSRADLSAGLASRSSEETYRAYLAGGRYYNELFDFCERAMAAHLLGQVHRNHQRAIRIVQIDVGRIGSMMFVLLSTITFHLICEAQRRSREKGRVIIRSTLLERKRDNHSIPIFIHPPDYTREYFELSKSFKRSRNTP